MVWKLNDKTDVPVVFFLAAKFEMGEN